MIKLPVIVLEGCDVMVYPSVQACTLHLEPWDVKDGIYDAFDADGQKLVLFVEEEKQEKKYFFGLLLEKETYRFIGLRELHPQQFCAEELRQRILKCSGKSGSSETLDELIAAEKKQMPWAAEF